MPSASIPRQATTRSTAPRRSLRATRRGGAFTILELLIVISIIVIGTAVAVPAVGRVIESNNYASAVNLVTSALGSARAEAIRTGKSTAVVFMFDIETEIMTLQVCEEQGRGSGSLSQYLVPGSQEYPYCRAYRPARGAVPIELPKGTAVYGLSFSIAPGDSSEPGSMIDDEHPTWHWYAGEIIEEGTERQEWPWIFPRNDVRLFIDSTQPFSTAIPSLAEIWGTDSAEAALAVRHANTFMIQFDESGAVVQFAEEMINAYLELTDAPLKLDDQELGPLDDPTRFDPEFAWEEGTGPADYTPNPEIVLRSAHQLAVVDMSRLSREVGVRFPWLLRVADDTAPMSTEVQRANATNGEQLVRDVSDWIDVNAEILSFNRFTGQVLKRARQ